jgi:hypothetical protein
MQVWTSARASVLLGVVLASPAAAQPLIATFDAFAEGDSFSTLTDGGITFSGLDQRLDGGSFIIEAAGGPEVALLGSLFSPPNYLTFGGYSPGPGFGFGRFGSARVTFGPLPATHASMSVFGGDAPNFLTLVALRSGTQVGSSTIDFSELTEPLSVQTLSISNVVFDELRLVASGPAFEGIVTIGLDNVRITPVPELSTLALLGAGLLGLLVRMRGAGS